MAHSVKIVILLSGILIIIGMQEVLARPGIQGEYEMSHPFEDKCENDDKKIEVCQRCAKQTKSPIVYPMCCQNEDDALNWCVEFINYGVKPHQ